MINLRLLINLKRWKTGKLTCKLFLESLHKFSKLKNNFEGFTMKLDPKPRHGNTVKENSRSSISKLLDDKSRLERENEQLRLQIQQKTRISMIKPINEISVDQHLSLEDDLPFSDHNNTSGTSTNR